MSTKAEVQLEAVKALKQARKLARRENNVEALLAVANLGLQFTVSHNHETTSAATPPTLGFGVDHD